MTFDMQRAHDVLAKCKELQFGSRYYAQEACRCMFSACDEIKSQAASLDAAEALIRKNAETINAQAKRMVELESLNDDLLANCNQLRDRCWKAEGELDRWQKIAIDERAISNMLAGGMATREDWNTGIVCKKDFREIATRELNLQVTREAGYVDRLEAAFLVAERDRAHHLNIGWRDEDEPEMTWDQATQEAQAALVKIRKGKP